MRILLTGTGTPIPSAKCAGPGTCIYVEDHETDNQTRQVLQFDTGRGTVMRLSAAGVHTRDITAVFLTHYHSDHVVDLADVALTRWSVAESGNFSPLQVYAPVGPCAMFARTVLLPYFYDIVARQCHGTAGRDEESMPLIEVHSFETSSSQPTIVYSNDTVRVSAISVEHEPVENAVAYSVECFSADGVKHVVISGDTRECMAIERLIVPEVTTVVHEAMLMPSEPQQDEDGESQPRRRAGIAEYHACVVELSRQMTRCRVPRLILTHLIPEASTQEHREFWEATVRASGFMEELHIGRDGLIVDI